MGDLLGSKTSISLGDPNSPLEGCCTRGTAVPWNEPWKVVELRLWSMLSTAAVVNSVSDRDRVNAEIVHFYAKKCQKMQHQNFNASQDARCWLEDLTLLTLNVEQILLFEWLKKFLNKAKRLHIVVAILNLTTQRGLETIYTSGKLEWAPPHVCSLFDRSSGHYEPWKGRKT